jgi:hypothetical protein
METWCRSSQSESLHAGTSHKRPWRDSAPLPRMPDLPGGCLRDSCATTALPAEVAATMAVLARKMLAGGEAVGAAVAATSCGGCWNEAVVRLRSRRRRRRRLAVRILWWREG